MRVAMITDYAEHGDKLDGGVQAVARYLIGGFIARRDLDLHVVSIKYGINKAKILKCDGYVHHILPGTRFGALTGYWRDQKTLNRTLADIGPDIVHAQGIGQNGIIAARSEFPTVLAIHGILAEEAKFCSGFVNKTRHRIINFWSEYYCVSKAQHTILISPYVAEYFKERLTGKHYLVPNPVSDAFFSIKRRPENGRILFAGRIRYLKGILDLVQAMANVTNSHDVKLILAGSLDDKPYVTRLRQSVQRLGIEKVVDFCGLLDEKQLNDELARCAVLVLPSYQETAPMVIAEAMAAGVPIIATNVGGVRYQVRDGESGFIVEPRNVDELSNRLDKLLSNQGLCEAFGNSARQLAGEEYRADRVVDRTVDVYEKVLNG